MKINISRVEIDVLKKEIVVFDENFDDYRDNVDYRSLWPETCNENVTLASIDKPSGVLRVWCNLIENLSFTCIVAVGQYQLQAVDMLFVILQDLISMPGKFPSPPSSHTRANYFTLPTRNFVRRHRFRSLLH